MPCQTTTCLYPLKSQTDHEYDESIMSSFCFVFQLNPFGSCPQAEIGTSPMALAFLVVAAAMPAALGGALLHQSLS